ncbi:hypothetical protein MMC24_004136 [Lignoscripta atroalba]|nr:hypothetical protein [Lignoscripta atroalba]
MALQIPYLSRTATSAQLVVKGKPMLMLAAELQNSSMTSPEYMAPQWQKLVDTNINTVLGCVTWEQIEPTEGTFDFKVLDQIILDARSHGLHLVLLWFGSFKNGLSTYAPAWVKRDCKRFPRAHLRKEGGIVKTSDCLSVFHTEALKADANAFRKLMTHVKEFDEKHSTVIMVQVENEVGILGDSRDGSKAANKRFSEPVPEEMTDYLNLYWPSLHPLLKDNLSHFKSLKDPTGSWEQVFGKSKQTDELFMAYYYARYVNQVAEAGNKAYPIPHYTNVWMNFVERATAAGGGGQPGEYPSGGSVAHVIDIWKAFAPYIDFISPDIYLNDYEKTCRDYRHLNQPLFIPEQRRDEYGARRVWSAIGSHLAIGTSPFGIDTLEPLTNPYTRHYGLLASVSSYILDAQRTPGSSMGFYFDEVSSVGPDTTDPWTATFDSISVTIKRAFVFGKPGPGAGMIIHLSGARFLLFGWGFSATFESTNSKSTFTGILSFEEKEVDRDSGMLKTLRMLNGDETRSGACCVMPNEEPDYGGFPIAITIPARTAIAEVEIYTLEEDEDI